MLAFVKALCSQGLTLGTSGLLCLEERKLTDMEQQLKPSVLQPSEALPLSGAGPLCEAF